MSSWPLPPLPARFFDPGQNPFVGRRHEVASLEEVWARVEQGQRQAVFVGGEPGSGKTRLAAEAARALHRQEVAVLLGGPPTPPDTAAPQHPAPPTRPAPSSKRREPGQSKKRWNQKPRINQCQAPTGASVAQEPKPRPQNVAQQPEPQCPS